MSEFVEIGNSILRRKDIEFVMPDFDAERVFIRFYGGHSSTFAESYASVRAKLIGEKPE